MALEGVMRPGHAQIRVLELKAAVHFYREVLGLVETGRDDQGRVYLKCWDERDHSSIVLREAESAGIDFIGFKVRDEATLDSFAGKLAAAGLDPVTLPAGDLLETGRRVRFTLPSGHAVELFATKTQVGNGMPTTNPDPWYEQSEKGIAPVRFDHALLYGPNIAEVKRIFIDILGFYLVERVLGPDGESEVALWLSCGQKVHDIAFARGQKMRGMGITVDFAPVADVTTESDDEVIGDRSFGSDPAKVTEYAGAYARGLWDAGVLPVLKHFPGHGHASGDSHTGGVTTPPIGDLQNDDLIPYRTLTTAQPVAVMVGHMQVPGLTGSDPASLSPAAYNLLRSGGYGGPPFGGIVFTDDLSSMGAINQRYSVPDAVLKKPARLTAEEYAVIKTHPGIGERLMQGHISMVSQSGGTAAATQALANREGVGLGLVDTGDEHLLPAEQPVGPDRVVLASRHDLGRNARFVFRHPCQRCIRIVARYRARARCRFDFGRRHLGPGRARRGDLRSTDQPTGQCRGSSADRQQFDASSDGHPRLGEL